MTNTLKTISILLATTTIVAVTIAVVWLATYTLITYTSTDTSDWFTPESNAPVLEVHYNGTGQTVNKQLTIDAAELQGGEQQ